MLSGEHEGRTVASDGRFPALGEEFRPVRQVSLALGVVASAMVDSWQVRFRSGRGLYAGVFPHSFFHNVAASQQSRQLSCSYGSVMDAGGTGTSSSGK